MKKIISKNLAGVRIDKFLKREIFFNSKITRGEIIRNIKTGKILVNAKTIKPSYVLKEGDTIEIMEHGTWNMEHKLAKQNAKVQLAVIYKDKNIIVIDKPARLQVHPSAKGETDTLVNGLLAKFPEIKTVGDEPDIRPGIVHRLDKDTSGIIIVARNQKTFLKLKEKFQKREMEKIYWAIVSGKVGKPGDRGIINKPLARSTNYKKQVVAGKKTKTVIREAITHYEILKAGDGFSLLEVSPKTGRTHQIRIHLASIGHPVIGDKLYGTNKLKHKMAATRQLLHAKKLKFELYGNKYEFEAPLPDDFPVD